MDIAQLGLEIRSDGVVVATKRLRDFEGAGARAEAVTGSLIRMATRAGAALAGAFGVSALARYADQWSDLQSQVGAAVKDMDAAGALMGRLGAMARASYSPLEQTVSAYARNAGVLRDLGHGANATADYVEALNHSLVVTATRGERAASVQGALSKAMAVGKLQADGLETVLANGGRVAEALAAELGTTVSGLRAMATDGKITGAVIANSLINRLEDLRKEASEMPATLSDAGTIWRNTITEIVGRMDQATNASGSLAEKLIEMADAVRAGADGFIQFAVIVSENFERMVYWGGAYVTLMGVNYVTAMGLATAATTAKAVALRGLRLAIAGTGIGALAIILGDVTMKLWDAATATDDLASGIADAAKPANDFFTFMRNGAEALMATFSWLTDGISAAFMGAFATVYENYANLINGIRGGFRALGIADAIGMSGPDMNPKWATEVFNALADQTKASGERAAQLWAKTFGARVPELVDVDGIVGGLTTKTFGSVDDMWAGLRGPKATTQSTPLSKEAQKQIDAYKSLVRGAHEFIASQTLEQQALGMTAEAAARMRYEQELLNKAANDNIKLTPGMRNELMGLAAQMAAVEEATRRVTEIYNFGKDVFKGFFGDLKSGITEGKSLWESLGNAAANALDKIADRALSMAANGIFDMIFGSLMGGLTGGLMGSTAFTSPGGPGFLGGGASVWNSLVPSFNGGGHTGYGSRSGGLDGLGGFMAMLHPNETVVDHTRSYAANQNTSSQHVQIEVSISVDEGGNIVPLVRQVAGEEADIRVDYNNRKVMPRMINDMKSNSMVVNG